MKSKMGERKYTKIYFRVFPMEKMAWDHVKILDDHRTIYIRCLQELAKSKENVIPTFWTFRTDRVFYNNTQQEVYDTVIADVLNNLSEDRDAIIMGYGQTGTGKTLTMSGLNQTYEDRGILPRVIPDLFRLKRMSKNNLKVCIQVSYVEIARSTIIDLLQSYPNLVHSLKDITKVKVKSEEDTLKLIFTGEGRKEFAESSPYPSHRYNSICTFYITTKNLEMQNNNLSQCKLHVIDLAGIDTVGNFSSFFKSPRDIGSANLAKTQLEQFFLVLSEDIPEHIKVKFRLNPMLQYLGTSLSNSSVLRFIGHIRIFREDLLVTISMLRFGELIGGLKATKYEFNIENKEVSLEKVHQLELELKKMKMEAKYNYLLLHQDLGRSLNEDRFAHIQRTVSEYLQNKIGELTLLNVCDASIALEMLKMMCKKYEEEKLKDPSSGKIRKLSSSANSSRNKLHPKSSRASNKTSSTDTLTRKMTEEKVNVVKSRSDVKTMRKDRIASLQDTKIKPKASSSSLMRKSLSGRKKSQSSASIREARLKSKSDNILVPDEIPPEYNEVWGLYMREKIHDYGHFVELYQQNESKAKISYKTYLAELDSLRQITGQIDKIRNDMLMAKITRQFQNAEMYDDNGERVLSEFEQCSSQELGKFEKEQREKQEIVLKSQAELKLYVNVCKQVKQELKDHFDQYCKEKYQMPLAESIDEDVTMMDIEEIFEEKQDEAEQREENAVLAVNKEKGQFEDFKRLIEIGKRKKKLYQMKHKDYCTLLH